MKRNIWKLAAMVLCGLFWFAVIAAMAREQSPPPAQAPPAAAAAATERTAQPGVAVLPKAQAAPAAFVTGYDELTALIVAIQELQKETEEREAGLKALRDRVQRLAQTLRAQMPAGMNYDEKTKQFIPPAPAPAAAPPAPAAPTPPIAEPKKP